ncbi:MAG TPA: carotenoid oxygenase family protein, partial [Rhizobacter sp.]|nr:carotenoid oxygenase family protein [Rhizobacter sp.]
NSDSDRYTEELLSELMLEFPRIDERFTMQPHRHGYFVSGSANPNLTEVTDRSAIVHIDTHTGATSQWRPEAGDYCSEPVFVPRSAEAAEGDGWLLTVVYRGATQCSDLVVLDARDVAAGPLAQVHLSHRVPAGFHGNWVPAA